MGRAPCCDKANVKKGPWSPEEDAKLKAYMEENGTGGNWIALPQKIGLKRCGKSCRLRWLNYLRPNIRHGGFSEEEDDMICSLYLTIGSRWSIIAAQMPGRTDNDIKNYWNTRLKKKLIRKQHKDQRQASSLLIKQEMKTEEGTESFMGSQAMNCPLDHDQYWPELALVVAAANPSREGEDHHHHHQPRNIRYGTNILHHPIDVSLIQDQLLYDSSMTTLASSTSMNSVTMTNYLPFPNMQFQRFHDYPIPVELGELSYNTQQQCLEELESFSGAAMVNCSSGTCSTSADSNGNWGDINSLVYPPMAYNYEACWKGGLQVEGFKFEEARYFGSQ